MGSFPMAVYYLHDIVHGAKWVRFLDKVFCETGVVAVMAVSCPLFLCNVWGTVCRSVRHVLLQSGQISL